MNEPTVLLTGPDQKPSPHPFYGDSYERGVDPWHPSAFVGTPAEGRMGDAASPIREGWYLIDGCGNEIGWIPDGTPIDTKQGGQIVVIAAEEEP